MDLARAQNRSDLLHFGVRLKDHLKPVSLLEIDGNASSARVTGALNLSHDDIVTTVSAKCCFRFVPNWSECIPSVKTDVSWLRRGDPNWHLFRDGSLCFVYGPQWRDELREAISETDIGIAAEFAVTWCVRSTRWLLYRHHFAFEHSITQWPKDWPSWPHDGTERIEYERIKTV